MGRVTRRIVRVAVAALLLLPALGASPAAAQGGGGEGRIVGRVTDGAGKAVEGARVVLVPADTSVPERTAVNGETGGFEFAALPAGTYTVRAATARAGREIRVTLAAGELQTLVARLRAGDGTVRVADEVRISAPRDRR
jgi:Carboxypeptidase regulatory-like domain